MMTIAGTELVTELSIRFLATRGITVTAKDGALHAPDGRAFGLTNVTSHCQQSPPDTWPDIIAAHFGALLTAYPTTTAPPTPTVAQLRRGTYLRMVPALDPTMAGAYTYARALGPTLTALFAYKDGDMVRWLRDEDIAPIGYDELYAIAKANLLALPYTAHTEVVGTSHLTVLHSTDHGFVASLALVLDEIAHPGPLFFAAPNRFTLAYTPNEEDTDVLALAEWANDMYASGPAPVSPHLHMFNNGRVTF